MRRKYDKLNYLNIIDISGTLKDKVGVLLFLIEFSISEKNNT